LNFYITIISSAGKSIVSASKKLNLDAEYLEKPAENLLAFLKNIP
jgi:hypothetical protein